MKFFVDTADTAAIRELHELGMVDGVTTNPSLIHKSGRNIKEVIAEIAEMVDGPVSAETVATDHETMVKEGHEVLKLGKGNIAVKVPHPAPCLTRCRRERRSKTAAWQTPARSLNPRQATSRSQ